MINHKSDKIPESLFQFYSPAAQNIMSKRNHSQNQQ